MSKKAIFQTIIALEALMLTAAKSVTLPPSKPTTHKAETTGAPSHVTTFDPEVFHCDPKDVDPRIKPYIDKHYKDSDFDKIIHTDGDKVTVLYDRDKEVEECDPEVKKILEEMEHESNEMYYPTEVNYFNHTIDHFINKTADELKGLQELNQIYKDLIDEPAKHIVQVAYGKVAVAFGNEINATDTVRPPTFVTWPAEKDSQYCLIMTDPDTRLHTRIHAREYQLWIVVNIPGNNLTAGEAITEYVRPFPEWDRGFHRFIFFVFKQTKKNMIYDEIKLSHIPVTSLRKDFSTRQFAAKNNLTGPVAINFFIACWDKKVEDDEDFWNVH